MLWLVTKPYKNHAKKQQIKIKLCCFCSNLDLTNQVNKLVTKMVLFLLKKNPYKSSEQGVCHTVTLSFRLKSIVRQKKDYENSNISPCKNIISS
jgi:hypothetical protein